MQSKIMKKLLKEAWESLCLHGRPWNTSLHDHLSLDAAIEEKSFEDYVKIHNVTRHPIRIDVVHFFWLAMGFAYNRFSKESQKYDEVVEFKEYSGEKALFGLLREYIVTGTGLKYGEKPKRLEHQKEDTQLMHVTGLEKTL